MLIDIDKLFSSFTLPPFEGLPKRFIASLCEWYHLVLDHQTKYLEFCALSNCYKYCFFLGTSVKSCLSAGGEVCEASRPQSCFRCHGKPDGSTPALVFQQPHRIVVSWMRQKSKCIQYRTYHLHLKRHWYLVFVLTCSLNSHKNALPPQSYLYQIYLG